MTQYCNEQIQCIKTPQSIKLRSFLYTLFPHQALPDVLLAHALFAHTVSNSFQFLLMMGEVFPIQIQHTEQRLGGILDSIASFFRIHVDFTKG